MGKCYPNHRRQSLKQKEENYVHKLHVFIQFAMSFRLTHDNWRIAHSSLLIASAESCAILVMTK